MLTLQNIAYRVDGRLLFEGVTAQIGARQRLGLVGRNGCGKTTLLRLIAGRYEPDEGAILRTRGLSVSLVDQEVPGGPETPREAVLAAHRERAVLIAEAEGADGTRRAEIEARLAEIGAHAAPARAARLLAGLGIDEAMQQAPLADLSGGWRMRVALAAALFVEPDLLLLDEPTNHLDLEAAAWLENHLKRYPRALVVVSHDRTLLDAVPDGILHMAGQGLTHYPGNYTRFAKTYAESLATARAQQARIDAKRRQMQGFVDRFRYKASKARQAQSRLKAMAKLADVPVVADERTPDLSVPRARRARAAADEPRGRRGRLRAGPPRAARRQPARRPRRAGGAARRERQRQVHLRQAAGGHAAAGAGHHNARAQARGRLLRAASD